MAYGRSRGNFPLCISTKRDVCNQFFFNQAFAEMAGCN